VVRQRSIDLVKYEFHTIHHFTTFHDSYLIEANFTISLENIGFSDLIGANFAIGYNI